MSSTFSVPDWDAGAAPSASFNFSKKKLKKSDEKKPNTKPDNKSGQPKPPQVLAKSKPAKAVSNPKPGQFVRLLSGNNPQAEKGNKRKHEEPKQGSKKTPNNQAISPKKRKLENTHTGVPSKNTNSQQKKLNGSNQKKSPKEKSNESPGKNGNQKNSTGKQQPSKGKYAANPISKNSVKKPENKFVKPVPVQPVKKVKKAKPAKPIQITDEESDTKLSAEINQFRTQLLKGFTGPKESDGNEQIEFSDAEDLNFSDSDDDQPKPKKTLFGNDAKTKEVKKAGTVQKAKVQKGESEDEEEIPTLVPMVDNSFRNKLIGNLKGSRFRFLNEIMYSSEGSNAVKLFKEDRGAFTAYHDGYRQQVEQWPLNPLDRIIKSIKKLPKTLVIADFGCGEGRLAKNVPQKTYSLDLVAHRHEIIACDMAKTPLETNSIDVAVYCLSLMGTNLKDFLLEANRVMKVNGTLKIAEVESRFDDVRKFVENVKSCGFQHVNTDSSSKFFVFINFKKVRNVEKGSKQVPEFSLKPCLYKKR